MSRLKQIFAEFEGAHPGAQINQSQLAEAAGIRQDRMSLIVNGLVPTDEVKTKIAEALSACIGTPYTVEDIWPEVGVLES